MSSVNAVLNVSEPRFKTGPVGDLAAAREAVELAQAAGLILDRWQVDALYAGLAQQNKKWAALEVGLIVPRQNGKGAILEAVELAGLFLWGERLILHSAHEFKTASEAFRRIWGLVESTPELDREVFRKLQNNNDMSIELKSGSRLRFVARSTGSGRGFSGDRVILDEAYKLSDRAVAALVPTLSGRPNPQIWYTSSAPLPNEDSDVLRRICRRGRAGEPNLAYIEYCADLDADLDARAEWYKANPSLGVVRIDGGGISEDWIGSVERGLFTDEDFARERLGIWRELDDRTPVIAVVDWQACQDPDSQPLDPVSFAVDVASDRSAASIAVAGMRIDGKVHVELIENRPGVPWVVDRLAALLRKAGQDAVTLCPSSPAGSLTNDLGLAGLRVNPCAHDDSVRACGAFFDGIMDRRYIHLPDPVLAVAVDGAEKRRSGDAWVWDRRSSANDITPLVAVTLAAWSLHKYKPELSTGFVDPNEE
jgi:hypothetical protein